VGFLGRDGGEFWEGTGWCRYIHKALRGWEIKSDIVCCHLLYPEEGLIFGLRLYQKRICFGIGREEAMNLLTTRISRLDISDARLVKPANMFSGHRGRNPGELKELPGFISVCTLGGERVINKFDLFLRE